MPIWLARRSSPSFPCRRSTMTTTYRTLDCASRQRIANVRIFGLLACAPSYAHAPDTPVPAGSARIHYQRRSTGQRVRQDARSAWLSRRQNNRMSSAFLGPQSGALAAFGRLKIRVVPVTNRPKRPPRPPRGANGVHPRAEGISPSYPRSTGSTIEHAITKAPKRTTIPA